MIQPTPTNIARLRAAFAEVERRAGLIEYATDMERAKLALRDVRDACLDAWDTINTVERETREAALRHAEQKDAA